MHYKKSNTCHLGCYLAGTEQAKHVKAWPNLTSQMPIIQITPAKQSPSDTPISN